MKNTVKILAILLVVISFQSCDKLEELADIDFNTSINQKIAIHIDQYQEGINETAIISLDNGDTHDYLDKFKSVSITKMSYKIIDFIGDPEGSVNIEISVDGVSLLQENSIVKQANDNNTIFEITDTNKLNVIAAALKNNHQVSVSVRGTSIVTNDAMDFKVDVTIDLAIVANALQ